jgi:hypothetical protein
LPTYRNDTRSRITFPDKAYMHWEPGEEKALVFFVPHADLGLTMVSDEPWVLRGKGRGFGYTEMNIAPGAATDERRWHLPYCETVEVSVYVLSGHVRMFVGDSDVPIVVDDKNNHVARYPWDMSAYLTFESDAVTDVYMKCEPFTNKGARKEAM